MAKALKPTTVHSGWIVFKILQNLQNSIFFEKAYFTNVLDLNNDCQISLIAILDAYLLDLYTHYFVGLNTSIWNHIIAADWMFEYLVTSLS